MVSGFAWEPPAVFSCYTVVMESTRNAGHVRVAKQPGVYQDERSLQNTAKGVV